MNFFSPQDPFHNVGDCFTCVCRQILGSIRKSSVCRPAGSNQAANTPEPMCRFDVLSAVANRVASAEIKRQVRCGFVIKKTIRFFAEAAVVVSVRTDVRTFQVEPQFLEELLKPSPKLPFREQSFLNSCLDGDHRAKETGHKQTPYSLIGSGNQHEFIQ